MGLFGDLVADFFSGGSGADEDSGPDPTAEEQEHDGGADANSGDDTDG